VRVNLNQLGAREALVHLSPARGLDRFGLGVDPPYLEKSGRR
jgi:hypothetical protein